MTVSEFLQKDHLHQEFSALMTTLNRLNTNVEEAKKLLAEAGYADGFKTTVWTNDNQQRIDTAIVLQDSLKKLNIEVELEVMEFGAYLEKTADGEHDMFILGWSNPTGDADYGMYALFHSSQKGNARKPFIL